MLAKKTLTQVNKYLEKGDQILFFLNRRGFSPHVLCNKCFNSYSCPNCSINLVYHKNKQNLLCHYCGFRTKLKRECEKGRKKKEERRRKQRGSKQRERRRGRKRPGPRRGR